jgi:hypothetical protein
MDANTLREVAIKVSQYFRDFLESDFKRQQAPRRRIVLQSESGFRAGMRVSPYAGLERELWNLLSRPSGGDLSFSMTPRRYTRPISATLKRVIDEQVVAIPDTAIVSVRKTVFDRAWATYASAVNQPEEWIDGIRTTLAEALGTQVVRPLIAHLDGPLRQQAYSVIDSLYAAEADMIARVGATLDAALPHALARLLATQQPTMLSEALASCLTLEAVHETLRSFFEAFVASDAYQEFRDLETYVTTGDGLQLYLYLGSVKFRGVAFPLFFLPAEAHRLPEGQGFTVKVVNHLFCNRRAIDFVLQELAAGLQRAWVSPIQERITYLDENQSVYEVARGLFNRVAAAMDLGGQVDFSSSAADASTASLTLSSALYLAAYERSDEALINDFEEIIDQARRGGSAIVDLFQGMVQGVLMENPVSIAETVESSWEELPMVDRVVFNAPVPLNEEQRKILLAVRAEKGRIVVVEGPPGTGKSHTITAIAADCAFQGRSCLVLSDKTEALDVVQGKLSDVMSRVRHERDFPNPILRLGQQHANFRQLTSNQAVTQISSYARAMKANQAQLESERIDASESLKRDIARTVETLGNITMPDMRGLHEDEATLTTLLPEILPVLARVQDASFLPELTTADSHGTELQTYLTILFRGRDFTPEKLTRHLEREAVVQQLIADQGMPQDWDHFDQFDAQKLRELADCLLRYQQLRMPVFGYLFRGAAVAELERRLQQLAPTRGFRLKQDSPALEKVRDVASRLLKALEKGELSELFPETFAALGRGQKPSPAATVTSQVVGLLNRIDPAIVSLLLSHPKDEPRAWPLVIRYLRRSVGIRTAFREAPEFDYVGTKTQLERLNTSVMNSHVDSRLVDFMANHRADAKALAAVITNRQKFPEEKFEGVRNSFPVMIASIREFGEYMPLVPDLFDVVIIDEASQVSVAQALPAVLRARKLVVLGDSKQFSNVKSTNASIELNDKYRADLVQYFERHVSRDAATLQRLAMFDVKRSILEFCSLGASYSVMLRKHFRSYQELIGYSSGTFYGHQLQAIKIRGVPLEEVVCFDQVEVAEGQGTRGTNPSEAEFILDRLLELVDEEDAPTVGVITPFRDQQTLISQKLFSHARARDFEDKLRLKVMTFDSCQGEERAIIFYSLVATPGHDALNYIFPVALDDPQQSVEHKLRVQRLNVGFSRAQECVWFVHSMPIESYRGALGQALAYYAGVLRRRDLGADNTDPSSPMEARVLDWLQKTPFVQANMDRIEILPQFPVGDYLRQLDPTYSHPAWRVDFLVTMQADHGQLHIVIEYDGFEFHFQPGRQVHVGNHDRYLNPADVERQLTLESYGYRFLRINRFNLGTDPVATLSERLFQLARRAGAEPTSQALAQVQTAAAGLASKEMKPCSRCGEILPIEAFFDPTLRGGEGGSGRVCMGCKGEAQQPSRGGSRRKKKRRRSW